MTEKTKRVSNQSELFRRAARELGCDESEERFNAALKQVARHKPVADKGGNNQRRRAKPNT
jgi:hypothetical protein